MYVTWVFKGIVIGIATAQAFLLSSVRINPAPCISPNWKLSLSDDPAEQSSSANDEEVREVEVDFEKLSAESADQAFSSFKASRDLSDMYVKTPTQRRAPRQAPWFPLLLAPVGLDGSLAGDVGFDPLGFCRLGLDASDAGTLEEQAKSRVRWMREAEMKHCRLAMLAAAGWPLSELWHKEIAGALGLDSILAASERAPSVLNGGLNNFWILGTGALALAVGALLEFRTFSLAEKDSYRPGDLGFDPLRLHSFRSTFRLDPVSDITEGVTREQQLQRAKFDMELCEVKNGRLAMLAVAGYAAQEFVTGIPVVQQTPFFFGDPII